jgi:hypothetical protein
MLFAIKKQMLNNGWYASIKNNKFPDNNDMQDSVLYIRLLGRNMDLANFLITFLSSAGASTVLAGVLVFLSRNWLSERLRHSIKHEYDLKLTHLNNELKAESEKNVILLKTSIEREAEKIRLANASISQTQKLSIERKLSAIETLWEGVLAARKNIPVVMGFIDILTEDEYSSMKNHRDFQAMVGELSTEKITQMYEDNVGSRERVRPYVGEYTWALVSTYQSIILRTALLIQMVKKIAKSSTGI